MKFALFICSLTVVSCTACTTIITKTPRNILTEDEYAVATQANHFVACKRAVKYACGITLSACNDGMKYECSQSVIIFNIKDIHTQYEEK